MSTTYDIVCDDCRKTLWIGQVDYIYTGHPEVMEALRDFLYSHKGHTLRFLSEHDEPTYTYEAIKVHRDGTEEGE